MFDGKKGEKKKHTRVTSTKYIVTFPSGDTSVPLSKPRASKFAKQTGGLLKKLKVDFRL